MGAILDIVGSLAIRGVILVIIINLSLTMRDALYQKTSRATALQNLSNAAGIIEKDVKMLGYNVASKPYVLNAESQRLRFLADLDNNSIVDTVEYKFSADPLLWPDTLTKVIIRSVSGQPSLRIAKGKQLTLSFEYDDSTGVVTSIINNIFAIGVKMALAQDYFQKDSVAYVRREFHIFPTNL